jgi:hypothetical protein
MSGHGEVEPGQYSSDAASIARFGRIALQVVTPLYMTGIVLRGMVDTLNHQEIMDDVVEFAGVTLGGATATAALSLLEEYYTQKSNQLRQPPEN